MHFGKYISCIKGQESHVFLLGKADLEYLAVKENSRALVTFEQGFITVRAASDFRSGPGDVLERLLNLRRTMFYCRFQ